MSPALRARLLLTLALSTLALRGREEAMATLAAAREAAESQGADEVVALTHVQEAAICVQCSDWSSALSAIERGRPLLHLLTPRDRCSALLNSGLSHISLLDLEAGRSDLNDALALALTHGSAAQEFKARHNLGCLEHFAGNLPGAIRLMRSAAALEVDVERSRARHDLAVVLLEAGLVDEATTQLEAALAASRAQRHRIGQGDILVDLARAALLVGDTAAARRHIRRAITAYGSRALGPRVEHARLVLAVIDLGHGRRPRQVPDPDGVAARTPEGRLALRVAAETDLLAGDGTIARRVLRRLAHTPNPGLAAALHEDLLRARLADREGRAASTRRALRRANRRLAQGQAQVRSPEVRTGLALHGRALAEFDLRRALQAGTMSGIFEAVERWRAVSHRVPALAPPADPTIARLLTELRVTRRALALEAGPAPELEARARHLEREISQATWAAESVADVTEEPVGLDQARAQAAARDESVVVTFRDGPSIRAIVVGRDQTRMVTVADVETVSRLCTQLQRDLQARARAVPIPALSAALDGAVRQSLARLSDLVVTPLGLPGHGRVAVIPQRGLALVPWCALPGLRGRPITVSTSVTRWHTTYRLGARPRAEALCGPSLPEAATEVRDVARAWGVPAVPVAAGADAVVRAVAEADLVHLAAHGQHAAQSPMFSSLSMADGPLFAHELPAAPRASHVVLSACDVGRSTLGPGDEPLGLTAAFLTLGVTAVVAAVAPVGDAAAHRAMAAYHERLAAGRCAAEALAEVIDTQPGAEAFCLYGSDWRWDAA